MAKSAHRTGAHLPGHAHAHEAEGTAHARLIAGRRAHRIGRRRRQAASPHVRIAHDRAVLDLLDAALIFFLGLDRRDAERDDLNAALLAPVLREFLTELVADILRVVDELRIADALGRDAPEGRLQGRQQLTLELRVDLRALVHGVEVAADVRVEQDGIRDAVAVFAETADVDVQQVWSDHRLKLDGLRRAVLVAHDLLRVEVVDALILRRIAAKCEALAHIAEDGLEITCQVAAKDGRLRRAVVDVLARLGADLDDLALLDDHHALALIDDDDRPLRDDIVLARGVGTPAPRTRALLSLCGQRVLVEAVTVEEFFPLIGHDAICRAHCCLDKTHDNPPFLTIQNDSEQRLRMRPAELPSPSPPPGTAEAAACPSCRRRTFPGMSVS